MKRSLLFSICIFCLINCFSQNRNNTWYFGNYTGLNFNTNPPTALTDATFGTAEGCASISDNNGNLLFYTEGQSVWDRNHNVMPNGTGLKGDWTSTQNVLIVPKPCDNNIYYIFTVPTVEANPDTMYYSVLDISLNGGLGDITIKNVFLRKEIREKLTGVLKSNGTDYWVIVKESNSDAFLSFSVTATGVDPVPVISHVGTAILHNDEIGYMQVSPDNTKLCLAYYISSVCQLLDFDNATGMVSNPVDLSVSNPYGVEFSPDNSKLYVSESYNHKLHQFNLLAGSPANIQNSDVLIASTPFDAGALMLGPDNKIYLSAGFQHFISVIDQPNQSGTACNFISQYINLGPNIVNMYECYLGLPNNLKHFSSCFQCLAALNINSSINICSGQTYTLPSGAIVSTPGIYSDTIKNVAGSCDSIIHTINLSLQTVSLLNTSAQICSNQTYQLSSGEIVNTAGFYQDTIRSVSSCDSVINTIYLFVNDISYSSQVDSINYGQTYTLPSGVIVSSEGTYHSVLTNGSGCDSVITTVLKLKNPVSECITLKNAITPNGDGINDFWILYTYNCFKRLAVNVYNRYGSLVYHSDDYKNDWDGKYKNKELPDGTYYYVMKVMTLDGKEYIFRDNVTIVR